MGTPFLPREGMQEIAEIIRKIHRRLDILEQPTAEQLNRTTSKSTITVSVSAHEAVTVTGSYQSVLGRGITIPDGFTRATVFSAVTGIVENGNPSTSSSAALRLGAGIAGVSIAPSTSPQTFTWITGTRVGSMSVTHVAAYEDLVAGDQIAVSVLMSFADTVGSIASASVNAVATFAR